MSRGVLTHECRVEGDEREVGAKKGMSTGGRRWQSGGGGGEGRENNRREAKIVTRGRRD